MENQELRHHIATTFKEGIGWPDETSQTNKQETLGGPVIKKRGGTNNPSLITHMIRDKASGKND